MLRGFAIGYFIRVYSNPFSILLTVLALMVSWFLNHSIIWIIVHGILAIPYLIYCLLLGRFADGQFMVIITSYF